MLVYMYRGAGRELITEAINQEAVLSTNPLYIQQSLLEKAPGEDLGGRQGWRIRF